MTEVTSLPLPTSFKSKYLPFDDLGVTLQYEGDNRILPGIPKSIAELNMHIGKCYSLKDSNKYTLFYVDEENDKIDIGHNRDLKNAYKVGINSNIAILTIYIWRKDKGQPIMNAYLNNKGLKDPESWDLPPILNADLNPNQRKAELKPIITRNLHKYHLHGRYREYIYYRCENYVNLNCPGIWKIKLGSDHDQGEIFKEHTARFEDHTYTREILHQNRILEEEINSMKTEHQLMMSIPVQYQIQNIGILKQDEIKILNDIKGFAIQRLNMNGLMTRNDFIAACSKMPDFFNIMQTQLPIVDHIFADCQKQVQNYRKKEIHFESLISQLPDVSKAINPIFGLIPLTFDVHKVLTNRNTQFGRDIISKLDKDTRIINGIITFLSDNGIKILRESKNIQSVYYISYEELDIGVDKINHQITIMIKIEEKFEPVIYALLSNLNKPTLQMLIEWIKTELGEFFAPKMLITDLKEQIPNVLAEIFPEAQIKLCQYKFTLDLWRIADKLVLLDRLIPNMDLISIIQKLRKIPSMKIDDAKETFKYLRDKYSEKGSCPKELICEFFNIFEKKYMDNEVLNLGSNTIFTNEEGDLFELVNKTAECFSKVCRGIANKIKKNNKSQVSKIDETAGFLKELESTYFGGKNQQVKLCFNDQLNSTDKLEVSETSHLKLCYFECLEDKSSFLSLSVVTKEEVVEPAK